MFIIQQAQRTLYPHRFIHIIQLHNQYTCDCRHAQSGEPCVHEVMLRDSMLDFSTKCPYDETAPEAQLDSNGERVYVSQNNQVVPVCCFATGRIRAICSVQLDQLSFVHFLSNGRYTCRVHRKQGCAHVHAMKLWLFPRDLLDVEVTNTRNDWILCDACASVLDLAH